MMRAQGADAQPYDGIEAAEPESWAGESAGQEHLSEWIYDEEPEAPKGPRLLAGILIVAALLWIGASIWSIQLARPPFNLATLLTTIGFVSGPLILLGLVWALFGRTPRRESERFTHALAAMRRESAALEGLLGQVATRLEENHTRLSSEAGKLMRLSDEASDRLGRVTFYLAKEGAVLDRKAQALETAAEAARVDLGVMLQDLPRAEEQARSLSNVLRETGLTAHEQAGALEGQVAALAARGREADDSAGGAAQRLAAHLARIESSAVSASERMDAAAASMAAAIDGAMARAAEAVDTTRGGIDEQSHALLAMIEQGRAAFERAGDDTGRSLRDRLGEIEARMASLSERIAAEDAASQSLVSTLSRDIASLDDQLVRLGESGRGNNDLIAASIALLGIEAANLDQAMAAGAERATGLTSHASELSEQLGMVTRQLRDELGQALAEVEAQAGRTSEATHRVTPDVAALNAAAAQTIDLLAKSEADIARQRDAAEALVGIVGTNVGDTERTLQSLAAAIGEADEAAARLSGQSGAALIDALAQVREAATHAAERAREAIETVIPQSAASLADASREAVSQAIGGEVNRQMGEVGAVAEQAVEAARAASERLTQQLVAIGAAAAAVEAQIEDGRRERDEQSSEAYSRRVALLIESLNSTAIDVTKILSNDVTDGAWNAYLKGDRGVFTRRAVRLLDATEAREIAQHYESEPEFRDQVNRYVHDFEAMLRRVLAEREGSALGVTLLSSDMGKLYVALAQAIDRLR